MISPSEALAILQKARNIAQGLYQAGKGINTYQVYENLYKAAPLDPPLPEDREAFINLLVKAKLLMSSENFEEIIVNNLAVIYQVYLMGGFKPDKKITPTEAAAAFNAKPLADGELLGMLNLANERHREFTAAQSKVAAKGYPLTAGMVANQVVATQQRTSAPTAAVENVHLDIFRNNMAEFIAPAAYKKAKEGTKAETEEKHTESMAKKNAIDIKPIPVIINQRTVFIEPRHVKRKNNLENNVMPRLAAATQEAQKAGTRPMSDENLERINTGISVYLLKKQTHANNAYVVENLKKTYPFNQPAYMPREFQGPASPPSPTDILAIIAIVADNDNSNPRVVKGMSISRIVAVGGVNGCYHSEPSSYNAMSSMESIERAIRAKLGDTPQAEQLLQALKQMQALNPNMKIEALFNDYMKKVMFNGASPPINRVVEICEADATANEYVEFMGEKLEKCRAYLAAEANLNPASPQCRRLANNLAMLNSDLSTGFARDRGDMDIDIDEVTEEGARVDEESVSTHRDTMPSALKGFIDILQQRIDSKKENTMTKDIQRAIAFRRAAAEMKQAKTEDALSEAARLIGEDLKLVLDEGPERHKTTQGELANTQRVDLLKNRKVELIDARKQLENHPYALAVKAKYGLMIVRNIHTLSEEQEGIFQNAVAVIEQERLNYNHLEARIDELERGVEDLEAKVEEYEAAGLLEDPKVIVRNICLKMQEARIKDGHINESSSETETQRKLFQQLVDALAVTPPEGPALAAYVKDEVMPELNNGVAPKNQIQVKVENVPKAAAPAPQTLDRKAFETLHTENALVKQRADLILQITALLAQKGNDNPKAAKLKNALYYLKGDYDPKRPYTVDKKYAQEAVGQVERDNKGKFNATLEIKKQWGEDRTAACLRQVTEHYTAVNAAQQSANQEPQKPRPD